MNGGKEPVLWGTLEERSESYKVVFEAFHIWLIEAAKRIGVLFSYLKGLHRPSSCI